MKTKSFSLRSEQIFLSDEQRLLLERLFFITRTMSNHFTNWFNKLSSQEKRKEVNNYATLENQLILDIEKLGTDPPKVGLVQVVELPLMLLRSSIFNIEYSQRRALININKPPVFKYPYEEQVLWLFDLSGLSINSDTISISGTPGIYIHLNKNKTKGKVILAKIEKSKLGDYHFTALYETLEENSQLDLIKLSRNIERSDRGRKSLSLSIYRRRNKVKHEAESNSFIYRRAIMFKLEKPEVPVEIEEEIDLNVSLLPSEEIYE